MMTDKDRLPDEIFHEITRQLNLPDRDKEYGNWTADERIGLVTLVVLICKYLDLDPSLTLAEVMAEAHKAMQEGRMPDQFFDEMVSLADQRRGGRIQ